VQQFLDALPEWVPDILSSFDSLVAIILGLAVIVGVIMKVPNRIWRRTRFYRQREQSRILDQLAIGRPLATVESALGQPRLLSRAYGIEERFYRLPGAWVILHAPDAVIEVYTITITDPKMFYDTGPATLESIRVRLGRDTFADAPGYPDGETFQIYAHLAAFIRYYDHGCNAAGNQYLWLAFNGVGAGTLQGAGDRSFATGRFAESFRADEGEDAVAPDYTGITVNTLTVADFKHHDRMLGRGFQGPHPQELLRG